MIEKSVPEQKVRKKVDLALRKLWLLQAEEALQRQLRRVLAARVYALLRCFRRLK